MQGRMVVSYRRFGTSYRSRLQGSVGLLETLFKIPRELRSYLHHDGSLKPRICLLILSATTRTHVSNVTLFWDILLQLMIFVNVLHDAITPSGPGPSHYRGLRITDTSCSVGLLWMRDQPDAETATRQHTTLTTDRHSCCRWYSNQQS
jgi:hypothetical protein